MDILGRCSFNLNGEEGRLFSCCPRLYPGRGDSWHTDVPKAEIKIFNPAIILLHLSAHFLLSSLSSWAPYGLLSLYPQITPVRKTAPVQRLHFLHSQFSTQLCVGGSLGPGTLIHCCCCYAKPRFPWCLGFQKVLQGLTLVAWNLLDEAGHGVVTDKATCCKEKLISAVNHL